MVVAAITCNDSGGDSCGGDKIRLVIVGSITLATFMEFEIENWMLNFFYSLHC